MRRRDTVLDIVLGVATKVIFLFFTICGLIFYAEYEWMMK